MSVTETIKNLAGRVGSRDGALTLQRNASKLFAERMLAKLELRSEKNRQGTLLGKKKNHDVWFYFKRIKNEMTELQQALKRYERNPNPTTREAVVNECCDVANFAAAVAEKVAENTITRISY